MEGIDTPYQVKLIYIIERNGKDLRKTIRTDNLRSSKESRNKGKTRKVLKKA
jgi:hypothetical protein